MPEPFYGNNATDYELELLRRSGAIKPSGPPQGGLVQWLGGLLADPRAAASSAAQAVTSDPVGVAKGLLVDPVVEMGKGWSDRVTGRVPVMDPVTGRTTQESYQLGTDIASGLGGVGGVKTGVQRAIRGAPDGPSVGIFAGEGAKTANLAARDRAMKMEAEGADMRQIWDATGWFKAPDGKWRWEIDDSDLRLLSREEMKDNANEMVGKSKELTSWAKGKERETKKQPDLFPGLLAEDIQRAKAQAGGLNEELADKTYGPRAYHDRPMKPELVHDKSKPITERLRGQRLKYATSDSGFGKAYPNENEKLMINSNVGLGILRPNVTGAMLPNDGMVVLNARLKSRPDSQLDTLVHELQHVVQDKEDFSSGFSSQAVWDSKDPLIAEARDMAILKEMGIGSIDDHKEVTKSLNPASRQWTDEEWVSDYKSAIEDARKAADSLPKAVKRNIAFDIYESVMGEAEARLAAQRRTMGPLERRMNYPLDDLGLDVDRKPEDLIPYRDEDRMRLSEGGLLGGARLRDEGQLGRTNKKRSTIKKPERVAYPGIYDRPDEIARKAAERVAPEDPALKEVFGVTRDDLYEMGKGRVGNVEAQLPKNATSGKNANAEKIMTPKNTQRMLDTLSEARKHPGLEKGMVPWYVSDPLYQQFVRLYGPEKAYDEFSRFNTFTGMSSPGSDVLTEINRGTGANYLHRQGRFDDFQRYAGKADNPRPADMADIKGHPYHSTSHAGPMSRYIERGDISDMTTTKVPLYIQSNTNPVAYQSSRPVGDAHFVRGVGLSDARTAAGYGESIKNTELATIAPWWKKKVADELGLTPVEAQALSWGTFGHATGVDTPIGAPKLELLAIRIKEAAKRYNISIEEARDLVLKGGGYASVGGGLLGAMPSGGEEPVY